MAVTVTLDVAAAGGKRQETANGIRLEVPVRTPVAFTAKVAGATAGSEPAELELRLAGVKVAALAKKGAEYVAAYTVEKDGKYTAVVAGEGGAVTATSDPVSIAFPKPAEPAAAPAGGAGGGGGNGEDGNGSGVVEASPGEFDPRFALWTGLAVLALCLVVAAGASWSLWRIAVPRHIVTLARDRVEAGSFGQRIGAGVTVAAFAIGAIALLAGAWLGSLETRGRLLKEAAARATVTGVRGADVTAIGDAAAKVLDKMTKMRAVVAVLACGTAIVLASLWVAARMVDAEPAGAGATTTTTSTTRPSTTTVPSTTAATTTTVAAPR